MFKARALDNESVVETDARLRFEEYCEKNCVSRRINLQNLMLKENSMIELAKILKNHAYGIARLNLRENQIRDQGIKILAEALSKNSSIVHLDIC